MSSMIYLFQFFFLSFLPLLSLSIHCFSLYVQSFFPTFSDCFPYCLSSFILRYTSSALTFYVQGISNILLQTNSVYREQVNDLISIYLTQIISIKHIAIKLFWNSEEAHAPFASLLDPRPIYTIFIHFIVDPNIICIKLITYKLFLFQFLIPPGLWSLIIDYIIKYNL